MNYKKNEIKEHIIEELNNYSWTEIIEKREDISELHNDLFNIDYYLIGYYNCRKWLSDEVFNVIEYIKNYETDNFGEVYTDLSSSEKVVNMYTYIIGEEILYNLLSERQGLLELYKNHKRS
tara:strand:+ start:1823 stop:2185 length:363 start_codon:yes stop_codon:yes gene_type:complete